MITKKAIVIGAGIVGLATARALALRGYQVIVLERSQQAVGASIRNFGMIWPIGQPTGDLYNRAIRSREVWQELCEAAGLWKDACGSLHLAYYPDELQVLTELYHLFSNSGRPVRLLSPNEIAASYNMVNPVGLLGGLFSPTEMIVDPRECINALPALLSANYPIEFKWGKCASFCNDQTVYVGDLEQYEAEVIFICSGSDFETLYPEQFSALPITKCKLQMMRIAAPPNHQRVGTSLCGGLSLIHYKSFMAAPSLVHLQRRFQAEMPEYLAAGIHVMMAQNGKGELTIGDSHEYGNTFDPFDCAQVNQQVLTYLKKFTQLQNWDIIQTWNGIYPKLTNGESHVFLSPEPGVYILNGLGGAGMTLSFGLAEEMVNAI